MCAINRAFGDNNEGRGVHEYFCDSDYETHLDLKISTPASTLLRFRANKGYQLPHPKEHWVSAQARSKDLEKERKSTPVKTSTPAKTVDPDPLQLRFRL